MRVTIFTACVLFVGSAGVALAQPKPRIEQAPMAQLPASDGAGMFQAYCSPCHGKLGRGDGPAAPALKTAPADLTGIAARNKGTFPEVRVKRFIEGADEVAAHGTRDMPIWGPAFRALNRDTAVLRVQALADYLRSIQKQ
jgi:mono/diheme cytochrome c family protein